MKRNNGSVVLWAWFTGATLLVSAAFAQEPVQKDPADVQVPQGYTLEVAASGLSFASDITFGANGEVYVAETGYHSYGLTPAEAPPTRILQIMPDGTSKVVYDQNVSFKDVRANASSNDMPEGLIPPLTGVTFNPDDGLLYVAHRTRVSTLNPQTGEFKTVVNGMPSWGFFPNDKVIFGPEGKMYFFLSTQGNAGPIDQEWMEVINALNKPDAREVPCQDVTLTGKNFAVPVEDPSTASVGDSELTGVYVTLGTETTAGQTIKGEVPCNGAFLRADPDGSNLEVYAWGLRSDYGYRFSADGRLIATQNSGNPIPPRPLYNDWEDIYEVQQGAWYGWPDFYSGLPITDKRFALKGTERGFTLSKKTRQALLGGRNKPIQPLVKLEPHIAAQGLVLGRGDFGVKNNEALVAAFGTNVGSLRETLPGFEVIRVNLETQKVTDFLINKSGKPASVSASGGLERPIQLEWAPDGSLFVVDFGVINVTQTGLKAEPGTATIWRVTQNP